MSTPRLRAIGALTIAILAVAVYANSLGNGLVFDDRITVRERVGNPFFSSYHGDAISWDSGLYRPIAVLTFSWNHRFAGDDPLSYHAINVVLHAGVSVLVLFAGALVGLPAWAAVAAAALFAVHPIHTEAVAHVSGRPDLLAAALFLGALLAWSRTGRVERSVERGALALTAVLYLLAALSKENALAFAAVALGYDLLLLPDPEEPLGTFVRRAWRRIVVKQAALAVCLGIYLALRLTVLGAFFPATVATEDNPIVSSGLVERWATATAVAARSLALLIFPAHLSPDYSYAAIVPVESPSEPRFLAGVAVLAVVAAGFGLAIAVRARRVAFAVWLVVATWAITSNLPMPIGTILAERLLYLPSVGFCLLLGFGAERLSAAVGRRPVVVALGALVVLGAGRTWVRNRDWKDDLTLFAKAAETVPRSVKVRNNYGMALLARGRPEEAREQLDAALSIDPRYHTARVNLAQSHLAEGRTDDAERELETVLDEAPAHSEALMIFVGILLRRGDLDRAEKLLLEVIEREPEFALAHARLGSVLAARRDDEGAIAALERAVAADPDLVLAWNDLGLLLAQAARTAEAAERFREAVRLDPTSVELRNNLGDALRQAGRPEEAVRELESALAQDPRFAPTHLNLGLALEEIGRLDDAARHLVTATEIRPDHAGAWRSLARVRLALGQDDTAIAAATRALELDERDARSLSVRARAHMRVGRSTEAEADYRRVVEIEPGSVTARNNLGVILAQRGDRAGARREWEEALRLAPDSAEIRDNLAKLGGGPTARRE